jgi:hypothetical protein
VIEPILKSNARSDFGAVSESQGAGLPNQCCLRFKNTAAPVFKYNARIASRPSQHLTPATRQTNDAIEF